MKTNRLWYFVMIGCLCLSIHTTLLAEATKTKIACVGNSITYGYGLKNPQQDAYPAVLQRMLGETYEVRNFGLSARTLLRKGDRPYFKESLFRQALQFAPDIVIIKLGTNDSKPDNWKHGDEFKQDLNDLIDSFYRYSPHATVYLCRPIPVRAATWGITDEVISNEIYPIIHAVATERGIQEIDLYKVLSDKKDLLTDNVHPNAEGAKLLAEEVYSVLTTPLAKKELRLLQKHRKNYQKSKE